MNIIGYFKLIELNMKEVVIRYDEQFGYIFKQIQICKKLF